MKHDQDAQKANLSPSLFPETEGNGGSGADLFSRSRNSFLPQGTPSMRPSLRPDEISAIKKNDDLRFEDALTPLEFRRTEYARLSAMAIHNGTAIVDSDEDDQTRFFASGDETDRQRQELCSILDAKELSKIDSDRAYLAAFTQQKPFKRLGRWASDAYDDVKKAVKTGDMPALGSMMKSAAKAVGRAVFKDIPKAVLSPIPKLVDALLPDALQTGPKLEMIEGLKKQKDDYLKAAEVAYVGDLRVIERKYNAMSDYVHQFYGDLIPAFDVSNPALVDKFLHECSEDTNSLHYQNVTRLVNLRREDRTMNYLEQKKKIEEDGSFAENIKMIRESSWLLRSMDSAGTAIDTFKESAKKSWQKKVVAPLREVSSNVVQGVKDLGKKIRQTRETYLDIPFAEMMISFGEAYEGRKFKSAEELKEHIRAQRAAKADSGSKKPTGPRSRKWLNGVAAAAAVGAAAILFSDNTTHNTADAGQSNDAADAGTGKRAGTAKTAERANAKNVSAEESAKVAPKAETQEPAATVSKPLPTAPKTGVQKVPSAGKPARTARRPATAKNTTVNTPAPEAKQVSINDNKTPVNAEDKVAEPLAPLEESVKMAQLRIVETKVDGYKQRVQRIMVDQARYQNLGETGASISNGLGQVSKKLDRILGEAKTLSSADQLTTINSLLSEIDSQLLLMDNTMNAVNTSDASVAVRMAEDLARETQRLSTHHGQHFKISHTDKTTNTRVLYNVNLTQINGRLADIHQKTRVNSNKMSVEEARLLRRDAEYWVGYLKFANWYLQNSPANIVKP